MTISSEVRKAGPYDGNDVTTSFPFSFKVFAASDMVVVRTDAIGAETTLTAGADYSVTLNADQDTAPGGSIVLPAPLASANLLTITSSVPNLQPLDLTNQGGFYPKVINAALDRLTIMAQQLAEQVGRAVKTSISSSSTPDQLFTYIGTAATNASNSATAAAGSATNSANSATASANSATASAGSATAAANSATQAAASAASIDVAAYAHAAASKATPVDADEIPLVDTAASWALKKLTWENLKATLKTYFDTLYAVPSQTGNAGKVLKTDGSAVSWDGAGVLGTAVNTTSGTAFDFTNIPSWVKKITVMLNEVSTTGTSGLLVQLGATAIQTTGYKSTAMDIATSGTGSLASTSGMAIRTFAATFGIVGGLILTKQGGDTWEAFGVVGRTTQDSNQILAGNVTLSGVLDRLRLTTVNGTDTFDAGSVNILYE